MLSTFQLNHHITFLPLVSLKHIEGFSKKRVNWLVEKIQKEQQWTKPLCVDNTHHLVMDGQHRLEAAKSLGLSYIPCVLFDYGEVDIWSLRDNYFVDHQSVIERSLLGNIYPYKTVKHRFPINIPEIAIPLKALLELELDVI